MPPPGPQDNRARLLKVPKHGRVLTLNDGRRIPYATSGSYADIFIDDHTWRVYKVFVSEPDGGPQGSLSAAGLNAIRRQSFENEVEAYRIAGTDSDLSPHIPPFFGTAQVAAVHDAAGRIVSNEYLLDACYAVQRLEGRDEKVNPWSDFAPAHIRAFVERCNDLGIHYVHDCSVFNLADPQQFLVIDFATKEIEMPW